MGISREQALDCFQSDDLVGIGMEADAVRRRLHPEGVVGYAMQAQVDCVALTDGNPSAGLDRLYAAIDQAEERGVEGLRLLGCGDAGRAEGLLQGIRQRFPSMWLEAFSVVEVHSIAETLGVNIREMLTRMIDAGLNSLADDGVLLADMPAHSASHALAQWLVVHRAAQGLGMRTVAGMVFGGTETLSQCVDFMLSVRQLQEETGGFAAFAPRAAEAPGGRELDGVTAVEQLKMLAISRMLLDNIATVQVDVTRGGLKVLQTCLRFGANDLGLIALDDGGREEDINRIIRDAGFQPARREMGYRAMLLA